MESLTPPQGLPRIIPANEVIPTMERIVAELRSARDAVVQTVEGPAARFDNVIKPFISVENRTQGEVGVIAMLRYASPDQDARDASEEALRLWRECEAEFTARQDIFLLVKAVKDKSEQLDREAAKYLDSLFMDFKRCGHGVLDENQIRLYLDKRNHIDNLRREYNQNIRDDDGRLAFSLDELKGVPQQDLDRFPRGSEPDKGEIRYVQLRKADLDALLNHAQDPTTRRRMHAADANKLPQNVDLFKKIIALRDENARLLGYDSYAAFKLEERLAKTPEWVTNFLDSLERVLLPQGRREMEALLEIKRSHLAEDLQDSPEHPGTMPSWDSGYYARIAEENLHVNHPKISEYFPLQSTVSAILGILASYLQFQFVPIPPKLMEGSRWHEDVEAWSVWDGDTSKSEFIGYLYVDLLSRPNKYHGSQNVNLQCGYLRDDGSRVYPATILMCSFPRPTTSGCALLKHHEIVTLFHELGHCIHDLVSRTSYVKFHGHRVPRDFVEAPAIFMENWCWMKQELKLISHHYTRLDPKYLEAWKIEHPEEPIPSERIPDEMLDGLIQSRYLNRALWFLYQLFIARFDMAVYHVQSHDECESLDMTGLYHDLLEKLVFVHNPDPRDRGHPYSDLGHLISGYDAGYYSYLSAHVIAADLFETAFAKYPRSQASWTKYRRGILEYGGSRDPLQFLEEFLGHTPNPEVLLSRFRKPD